MKKNFVYLVMPAFTSNIKLERERRDKISQWKKSFKKKVQDVLGENFQTDITIPIIDTKDNIMCETIATRYTAITKKGRLVRHELQKIMSLVEYSNIDASYFILVDGSGKIDFNSVYSILNGLKKKKMILGCRPHSFAISDERKKIELFENYLVSQKYNVVLPDAQCGCWGFCLNIFKDMSLSAESYEVELDVLINGLERNIDLGFTEISINDKEEVNKTEFTFDSNIEKLNFLCYKLSLERNKLKFCYENFVKETGSELPNEYISNFDKIDFAKIEYKKFDCVGGCSKICKKATKTNFN